MDLTKKKIRESLGIFWHDGFANKMVSLILVFIELVIGVVVILFCFELIVEVVNLTLILLADYCDGWAACQGQDVHCKEAHQVKHVLVLLK